MIIDPLKVSKAKEIALLFPGHRLLTVQTQWGTQRFTGKRDVDNALLKLSGFTCYVMSGLQTLKNANGATNWVLDTWHGRDVKMTHVPSGTVVTSLRHTLDASPDPWADLNLTMNWLRGYGVKPASVSSMAWQLFRASLARPVTIGFDPEIGRRALFGGRQESTRPDKYLKAKSVDIRAAYPTAMASKPMALSLRQVHPSTYLNPMEAGLAHAKVFVPHDLPHPPLPVRIDETAIQFQYGHIEGVWSWCELNAAQQLGCDVEVINAWGPKRTADLFGTWWDMAQTGRALPGAAGNLAKAVANSTWGQFAMTPGERNEVAWCDDRGDLPFITPVASRRMPQEWTIHVAAEITSRVRVQLLTEGLYGINAPTFHVDTDGIIISEDRELPQNAGTGFGQWSVKDHMDIIDLRAPQLYRYTKPDAPTVWHYVASGLTPDQAVRMFDKKTNSTRISFLGTGDVTLPPGSAHDEATISRLLEEMRALAV